MGSKYLYVFDMDGTLSSAGGPVTAQQVRYLRTPWGILSSRNQLRSIEACTQMGLVLAPYCQFIETCRVNMRAEELRMLREKYPGFARYIYVADRERDKAEAELTGWRFVYAKDFEAFLKEMNKL